mmetsp:Transcript_45649/g.90600  ORF Transcript_45649/g.90600 Transcript_45649/m.90600 type:complete len:157 (-) Transcript_45649:32-502(-)|eukprot:CAMPEP_0172719754 /NCGR_PEP_ID=MMETSP1074-20121228/75690_1 /TAXON_ID=2916 /ORGANISM="Ceratium fusus, Strain PA161109" /LENGTH=156 /DNA_ID=CAMNT_0013545145 /DNA_START=38 /DNA_END=508 /DNA_ORIENTATION=+
MSSKGSLRRAAWTFPFLVAAQLGCHLCLAGTPGMVPKAGTSNNVQVTLGQGMAELSANILLEAEEDEELQGAGPGDDHSAWAGALVADNCTKNSEETKELLKHVIALERLTAQHDTSLARLTRAVGQLRDVRLQHQALERCCEACPASGVSARPHN